MDPKKDNTRTGKDKGTKVVRNSKPSGNKTDNSSEVISSDPILSEKDELKMAEEKLRNKTNKK